MRPFFHLYLQVESISRNDAAGRVKDVRVTDFAALREKWPLYEERPVLAATYQPGSTCAGGEGQRQRCLPRCKAGQRRRKVLLFDVGFESSQRGLGKQ